MANLDPVALAALPIGTNNAQAFARNASDIDAIVNGAGSVFTRTGKELLSVDSALRKIGLEPPVVFASGLSITRGTQTITYSGNTYYANPASLPFATTGTFNAAQWLLLSNVTQAMLASTAAGSGASLIGVHDAGGNYAGATLEAALIEIAAAMSGQKVIPAGGTLAVTVASYPAATIALPPTNISANAVQLTAGTLKGAGNGLSKITASGATALKLGYANSPSVWAYKLLSDFEVDGNGRASDGVTFGAAVNTQVAGRWSLERMVFRYCRRAIDKPAGNIGNTFRNVAIEGCDFGYYAVGQNSPLMHAGNDLFDACHFAAIDKAGIYIDSPQIGTGGTKISNSAMEFCPGIPLFVRNWADSFSPITLDNVWFEGNGSAGTVNINGTNYTTVDIHLENCRQAVIINGLIPRVRFLNSHVACHDVAMNADATTWAIDSTATVTVDGANIDGGAHPVVVSSVATIRRALGNFTSRFQAPPRWVKAGATEAVVAQSIPFTSPQTFTGTATISGAVVTDGRSYSTCNELVVPPSNTLFPPAASVTAGKWYVLTLDAKTAVGNHADLTISIEDGVQIAPALNQLYFTQQWCTVAAIGPCNLSGTVRLRVTNSGASNITVRLGAYQLVEFDSERRAIEYYNAGFHQ